MTITEERFDTHRSAWGLDSPTEDPEEWKDRAVCASTDPEAFFPEKGGSTWEAKRICFGCEVRDACLDYALANDEKFGIWGGFSERERRRLKAGEKVVPAFANKSDRRPNGHGFKCLCFACKHTYGKGAV